MATPAEELRAAAMKIRDVAQRATPGPWLNLDHGDRIIRDPDATAREDDSDPCGAGPPVEYVVDEPLEYNPDNGDHIVLWDPVVAELVSRQLDLWATAFDDMTWINSRSGDPSTRTRGLTRLEQSALDLARHINGTVMEP